MIPHKLYIDGCHQSSSIFSPTVGKAGPGIAAGVTDTAQFNQSCTARALGRGRSLGWGQRNKLAEADGLLTSNCHQGHFTDS